MKKGAARTPLDQAAYPRPVFRQASMVTHGDAPADDAIKLTNADVTVIRFGSIQETLKGPVITASGGPWFLPSSALNIIQHSDERRAGPRK